MYFASNVLHQERRRWRMAIAAGFGGLSGTVMILYPVCSNGTITAFLGLVFSAASARIAWGRNSPGVFLRQAVVLWGTGSLLGGIMTFLMSLGTPVYGQKETPFYSAFLLCVLLSSAVLRLFQNGLSKKSADVSVRIGDRTASFRALCDSGSFLREPISGAPVILAGKGTLGEMGEHLWEPDSGMPVRMIPAEGIGGGCLLAGFVPDSVVLNGKEVEAVIAVDRERRTYGGLDGIVPAVLCK